MTARRLPFKFLLFFLSASLVLSGCQPQVASASRTGNPATAVSEVSYQLATPEPETSAPTPYPSRPQYSPGELVDYIAQTGDTLPTLAVRFNTSVQEILEANSFIPPDATTMPPGMPMRIPIYYIPFWGNPYQILPDSLFINGPAQVAFHSNDFINGYPGWLKYYRGFVSGETRTGAQIIDMVAQNYSISPRLLIALLEHHAGALSEPTIPAGKEDYVLGHTSYKYKGLYLQLTWAANLLNSSYYQWRLGTLTSFDLLSGRQERPDPWQNAATVSLQHFYARFLVDSAYAEAISPTGFAATYAAIFGDPWENEQPHIPGSLVQPEFSLPFKYGQTWALTGGPHTGWGQGDPWAALDFAPGNIASGCTPTGEFTIAVASGVVARSEYATVMLDLDGDGDERTGWNVLYFHLSSENRAPAGAVLNSGDPVGHPSCEGGQATGTHVHIARKYNGEWVPAAGMLAFNLEGWVAQNGSAPYLGRLVRNTRTVTASVNSQTHSHITSDLKR